MPGGAINITIGGNAQQLTQAAGQAANALNGFSNAASAAGNSATQAFDEIAAGAAAMARIEAAIEAAAAAARNASQTFEGIGSSAVQAITPLTTLENRLQEIRDGIGRAGTVQGAAQLGVQFDIVNRNLQETRARIDAATQSAISLSRAFNSVASATNSTGQSLNRLAPATRPSLQGLTLLNNASAQAGESLNQIRPGANQATFALTNLGRVAQDAPFGLIGIANNIEPLISSFISLRQTAGGAGGTFRALGASLLGPGGLILGIGLLSTVATLAGQGLFSAAKEVDEFRDAMKEANEAAGKEIANLRIAATIASDVTRSTDERKKAAKELQSQLKENNVTLSEEAILNGNVATAINLATKAILERAKARAIENRIAELTAQNLNRELERPEILRRQLETQKKLNEERAKAARAPAGAPADVGIRPETVGFATDALNKLVALDQATLDASAEINKLLALVKDEDISPKFDSDKVKKDTDLLKQRIAALKELQGLTGLDRAQQVQLAQLEIQLANRDSIKAGFTADELQQQIDGILEKAFPVKTFEFKLDKMILEPRTVELGANIDIAGNVLQGGNIPEGFFNPVVDKMKEAAAAAQEKIKADLKASFEESIAQSVTQGIFGAADSLGAAIGDLLSGESVGNVLASAGEGLLKIMGSILQDIGKQIALFSGLVAKIRSVVANVFTNPAAGIGLGLALVAAGALLRSIKLRTSTPGFADGVTNFTGGQALVGERGPELVTLPAGSNVIPRDPFSVLIPAPSLFARGDDLYLSYNRTASRRRRI